MNERIRELAEQVHVTGDPWKNKDEPEYLWFNFREDALEKFAELIVRECITQINEAIPDTDCSASGAYKTAKIAAMARVKDHFGVA
jgi:hypothetical protein